MSHRLLFGVAMVAGLLAFAAPASAAKKKSLYLSLGDSLAWGYTKAADGSVMQSERDFSSLLAARARGNRRYSRKLSVRRLGCPGETTATYRFGGKCEYAGFRSQYAAARAFVRRNRRRIAFITISIGTNNFTPCVRGLSVDIACIDRGNAEIDRDLGPIYRSLRRAAGRRAKIVTATQYDPYLALYLQGSDYRQLALLTVDIVRDVNATIRAAARGRKARVRIADVFTAFKTDSLTRTGVVNGQSVPEAVAALCSLTLMCQPAPVGPDIHPTNAGYAAMAAAFARALRI